MKCLPKYAYEPERCEHTGIWHARPGRVDDSLIPLFRQSCSVLQIQSAIFCLHRKEARRVEPGRDLQPRTGNAIEWSCKFCTDGNLQDIAGPDSPDTAGDNALWGHQSSSQFFGYEQWPDCTA